MEVSHIQIEEEPTCPLNKLPPRQQQRRDKRSRGDVHEEDLRLRSLSVDAEAEEVVLDPYFYI